MKAVVRMIGYFFTDFSASRTRNYYGNNKCESVVAGVSPAFLQRMLSELGVSLVFVANRTGAADVFFNRWRVAGVLNCARPSDNHFQRLSDCHLRISRAGSRDFSSLGLQFIRR